MPSYDSLNTQVELFKTKVTALSSVTMTPQDLVFMAKAIESMGNLLGVNDLVAASSAKITEINTASAGAVTSVANAGSTQITAVNNAGITATAGIAEVINNDTINTNMGVI